MSQANASNQVGIVVPIEQLDPQLLREIRDLKILLLGTIKPYSFHKAIPPNKPDTFGTTLAFGGKGIVMYFVLPPPM